MYFLSKLNIYLKDYAQLKSSYNSVNSSVSEMSLVSDVDMSCFGFKTVIWLLGILQ